MKETLGDSAPAYSTVTTWHAEFKRGRSSCDDLHWCGRLATSVNEETVQKSTNLSVCFIAESVGISTGRVRLILMENLLMKKMSAWWVPQMFSDAQKANRVDVSTSLLRLFNENPSNFISRFLTVDETWHHQFDPESKMQYILHYISTPPPRKCCVVASARKDMAIVFWDAKGIVLIDYGILNMAAPSQESTTLIWSEKFGRHWRRDEENCITGCCFTRTMHLLTSSQALAAIQLLTWFWARHICFYFTLFYFIFTCIFMI